MEVIRYTSSDNHLDCEILMKKNFLSENECNELICFYDASIAQKKAENVGFFNDRLIWFSHVPENILAKQIMRQSKHKAIQLITNYFNLTHPIYGDSIQLVSWPEGLGMRPHYDNRHPNPQEPHTTPWREYAGVVYLNDQYQGGEFYISSADPHITIKPEKGMLIIFGGGEGYMHGVHPAYGHTRYTMPCWFTRDSTKNEADYSSY